MRLKELLRYFIFTTLVLLLTFLSLYLSLRNNYQQIFEILDKTNIGVIVVILFLVVFMMFVRAFANNVLAKIYYKGFSLVDSIGVDQAATLSRMVTPACVGGHIVETAAYV